jgi:tetraacyldisaccharide 4'-kinase
MLTELIGPCVYVGADRVKTFESACKSGRYDCVILDDGFQQWGFARDLDIVLLDSKHPFGNGSLIPAGVLRETERNLKRAGCVVLTRIDRASPDEISMARTGVAKYNPSVFCALGSHIPGGIRSAFTGKKVLPGDIQGAAAAFCAIGDPDSFRSTLVKSGVDPQLFTAFPDHYLFTCEDMRKVVADCRARKLNRVITTHKDFVKIKASQDIFTGFELFIIDIEFVLTYGKTDILSIIRRLRRT